MKKTKIVCTMGPNTNDREMMRKLIQNGMNVARFNFSHGDHEEQKFRMDMLSGSSGQRWLEHIYLVCLIWMMIWLHSVLSVFLILMENI